MSDYIKIEDAKQLFMSHLGNHFPQSFKEKIVEKAFEELPLNVDVVEVVHGNWIEELSGNGWNDWVNLICSECGTKFREVDVLEHYKYCPNCGAKMDGEKK